MKLFDKILVGTAGLAAYGLIMLIFSGELNSEYYKEDIKPESMSVYKKTNDVMVYDKEIDEIIQAYYKNIKENPDKYEEENRLIQENDQTENGFREEDTSNVKKSEKKDSSLQYIKHKVINGDSLWRISQKYNVPVYTIISANPLKDREMIRPGELLNIPDHSGIMYTVKSGESVSTIAKKFKIAQSGIFRANGLQNHKIIVGQKIFLPDAKPADDFRIVTKNRFIWPIVGGITSGYGIRKHPLNNSQQFHTGIDIGGYIGEKIRAAADGIVVYSGNGGSYGNMVILRHKEGFLSIYAHASSLNVLKGQVVKQGDLIARVGSTGVATGPHLHFEVKKYNSVINPLQALKEKIKLKTALNS